MWHVAVDSGEFGYDENDKPFEAQSCTSDGNRSSKLGTYAMLDPFLGKAATLGICKGSCSIVIRGRSFRNQHIIRRLFHIVYLILLVLNVTSATIFSFLPTLFYFETPGLSPSAAPAPAPPPYPKPSPLLPHLPQNHNRFPPVPLICHSTPPVEVVFFLLCPTANEFRYLSFRRAIACLEY